jgi:hypothetical protein
MDTTNDPIESSANVVRTTGSCHCGEITYTVDGPILKQSYCDCAACHKATGTLRVPWITVQQASLTIDKGEPSTVRGATAGGCDRHGSWRFCRNCGTNLFWMPDHGDQVDVLAGTLDDVSLFRIED